MNDQINNTVRPEGTYKREGKIIRLYNQQNGKCFYCGCQMQLFRKDKDKPLPKNYATKDHLVPRESNGKGYIWNLVASCHECNHQRGHMDVYKFKSLKEMEQLCNG